jgi:cbb3-type cytochrome oxidase subunit 3
MRNSVIALIIFFIAGFVMLFMTLQKEKATYILKTAG